MRGSSQHAALRSWFGISDAQAAILDELLLGDGAWRSTEELAERGGICVASVKQLVSTLRRALDAEAIDSAPALGYRLTESGVGECRVAISRTAEELLNR